MTSNKSGTEDGIYRAIEKTEEGRTYWECSACSHRAISFKADGGPLTRENQAIACITHIFDRHKEDLAGNAARPKALKGVKFSVNPDGKTCCGDCRYETNRQSRIYEHFVSVHMKRPGVVECPLCRKFVTRDEKTWTRHHDGNPVLCLYFPSATARSVNISEGNTSTQDASGKNVTFQFIPYSREEEERPNVTTVESTLLNLSPPTLRHNIIYGLQPAETRVAQMPVTTFPQSSTLDPGSHRLQSSNTQYRQSYQPTPEGVLHDHRYPSPSRPAFQHNPSANPTNSAPTFPGYPSGYPNFHQHEYIPSPVASRSSTPRQRSASPREESTRHRQRSPVEEGRHRAESPAEEEDVFRLFTNG